MASANKSLGRFDLADIPPAPRGIPQIEVTFDIDANGILHVSAKDKATGKAQSIVIKASSGLSEDEIKRMVKDAEENKEADRKFHELISVRNLADNLVFATEKALRDLASDVQPDEKTKIEEAIANLKAVIKGDNKEDIEAKTKELSDASSKLMERVYAKKGQENAAAGAADTGTAQPEQKKEGDVVDAEFEEVGDKDKK